MNNKLRIIISIIIISSLLVISYGCNPTALKYNKVYTEYVYINYEGVFIESGRNLTLNKDNTFEIVYNEELALNGSYEHILREQTIYLDCDENASNVVKERFKEKILNDSENTIPLEILDMILDGIDVSEEIHYDKDYIFSTSFISAHRYIDTSLYDYGVDYSEFEGVYTVKDYDGLMLLKNGKIYVQDPEEPKTGEFPEYKGSYIYANDFITMTINDEEGNPQPSQKYLVADLILPFELKIEDNLSPITEDKEDDKWYEMIEDQLDELKGKKIKVLVLCFFTREKM